MTDAFWIAMWAAIPTSLGLLLSAILQLRAANKLRVAMDSKATQLQTAVIEPLVAMHGLVNGNLALERRRAEMAEAKVVELEARIVRTSGGKT